MHETGYHDYNNILETTIKKALGSRIDEERSQLR